MLSSKFGGESYVVGQKALIYLSLDASKLKTNVKNVEI